MRFSLCDPRLSVLTFCRANRCLTSISETKSCVYIAKGSTASDIDAACDLTLSQHILTCAAVAAVTTIA
jgi:hypothetical protein